MATSHSADRPSTSTSTSLREVTPQDNIFTVTELSHDLNPFLSPEAVPVNLLPPFAHLPTPTSPNNVVAYGNHFHPPESPLDHGSQVSRSSAISLGYPSGRPVFMSTRENSSRMAQMMTPDSSPLAPRSLPNQHHVPTPPLRPLSYHVDIIPNSNRAGGDVGEAKVADALTSLAPAHIISPPLSVRSNGTPSSSRVSTPFMYKLAAAKNQRASPMSADPRSPPPLNHHHAPRSMQPMAIDDVFSSTSPARPTSSDPFTSLAPPATPQAPPRPSPADHEQLQARLAADEAARLQAVELARPEYLKRAQPPSPAFARFDDSDHVLPGLGITVSPMKGRRIKLFQETSEESFEESLMAGGYGKYRTVPERPSTPEMQQRTLEWLEQGTPLPGGVPSTAAAGPPADEKELGAKEVLKRKRLAAFQSPSGPPTKLRAVEVEGIGRVVMGAEEQAAVVPADEPPTTKRGKGRKKKLLPVTRSPGKRKAGLMLEAEDTPIDGPGWLDSEFPWSLRASERAEGERREQAERLKWIEKYLERESDDENVSDDDAPAAPVRGPGRRYRETSMGSGMVLVPDGAADAKWHLQNIVMAHHHARHASPNDSTFMRPVCICKRVDDGSREIVQCDDCREWYHPECIGIRDVAELGGAHEPWFCYRCTLGRTPSPSRTPPPTLPPMRSEPAFAINHAMPRHLGTDVMFSQVQESPGLPSWAAFPGAPPSTPSRRNADGGSSVFSSRSSWGDSASRFGPTTPRSDARSGGPRVLATPGPYEGIVDEPFDPTSTPSRGFKASQPFATPKTAGWTRTGSGASWSGGLLGSPGKRYGIWGAGDDDEYRHMVETTPVGYATSQPTREMPAPRHPPSPSRRPIAPRPSSVETMRTWRSARSADEPVGRL